MHRLFVAIRPPAEIRDALLVLMGGIGGARWQDDDQLHLTLRFIGEVDRHVAADVHAALGGIRQAPFDLAISGVGMFDRRGIPTTIWAGVAPQEPVRTLNKKVEQAMMRAGLEPETRAFHPHVTLARLNRSSGSVEDYLARNGGASTPAFTVASLHLYESSLTPDGAIYTPLETYPLA